MKQRVLLKGKAGLDLLHRISSVDIKHLKLKQKTKGLLLNPAGKIESFFEIELLNQDEAEITFQDDFLALLDKFTFAEQYQITPLEPAPESLLSERARILELTPKLGNEFLPNGETNPLEINLRSAIADQKGCYPGQEVIEKIVSLGSPARKLCLLETQMIITSMQTPTPVTTPDGIEVGTMTSFDDRLALALIRRTHLKVGTELFAHQILFTVTQVSL
jgi:hypothetical protein